MSIINYHKATSRELLALTNKVRNLINHWGEDGRYKEAVLKNVIRRFLPKKYKIGTGFVIKQVENRGEHTSSRQIDLIIYDDSSPILFKEGDFVILTPDAIRGIIEVKANLQNQILTEVLKKANENGKFIYSGKEDKDELFFNGVFSYEGYNDFINYKTIEQNFSSGDLEYKDTQYYQNFKVNHVVLNNDLFIKLWNDSPKPHSMYYLKDLSFSFFISNLIDTLSNKSVKRNNFIWYATDKELNNVHQF